MQYQCMIKVRSKLVITNRIADKHTFIIFMWICLHLRMKKTCILDFFNEIYQKLSSINTKNIPNLGFLIELLLHFIITFYCI